MPAPKSESLSYTTTLVLFGLVLGLLTAPPPARAYTRETHYYLRFALALATCFDYDESHLIASGDWMMDGNLSTHAEPTPFQKKNKVGFHAFGHSDGRFNELWERSRVEPDLELRLIKLGQFMHFLEDWESHAGFGLALGHAKATFGGRDPDSLGSDKAKNNRMAQSALEHLLRTCVDIGRAGEPPHEGDVDYYLVWLMRLVLQDGLMDDLYEIGDPTWKKGKIKGIRKSHQVIRERSQQRIEEFVERLKAYPDKKVPEWFTAGDPERGIPPVLQIPYDKEGNILSKPGAPDPVEEVLARNRADREEEDLRVYIDGYSRFQGGFTVRLAAANVGTESADAGSIDVYVIDPDQQTELGKASVELEALAAGDRVDKKATVRAQVAEGQEVMIGAIVRVEDFSTLDNETWLMSEEEALASAEVPLVVDVDPDLPGDEAIVFTQDPKMWVIDGEAFCALVGAATTEGDASEKLTGVEMRIVTESGVPIGDREEWPPRWGASARQGPIIGAKSFACVSIDDDECSALSEHRPESVRARITVEGRDLEPLQGDFPVPGELLDAAKLVCESRSG